MTSAIWPAIGGGADWTELVAALEIASALADICAPVWLPALKLWARSFGVSAEGVCAVPTALPAEGAVVVVCVSMFGVVVGADVVGAATDGTDEISGVSRGPVVAVDALVVLIPTGTAVLVFAAVVVVPAIGALGVAVGVMGGLVLVAAAALAVPAVGVVGMLVGLSELVVPASVELV
jgi:hypothetical protein